MAHAYLDQFRKRVRSAHDPSGHTCHWTDTDELTSTLLYRDVRGPCNCPTPPASSACAEHGQYKCANTAAVLGVKTSAEDKYAPVLTSLGDSMSEIEDTIRSAEEAIRNLMKGGLHRGEAMDSDTLTLVIKGHVAPNRPHVHRILEDIALDQVPSTDLAPPSCHCKCWENKNARLKAERDYIEKIIAKVAEQAPEVLKAWNDGSPTFSNSLGRVIKDSIQIVLGAGEGEIGTVLNGLRDLMQYYTDSRKEGGQLYILYKAIAEIGELKRVGMLGTILHDQQLAAPTCSVTTSETGKVSYPVDGPSTAGHQPPVTSDPLEPDDGSGASEGTGETFTESMSGCLVKQIELKSINATPTPPADTVWIFEFTTAENGKKPFTGRFQASGLFPLRTPYYLLQDAFFPKQCEKDLLIPIRIVVGENDGHRPIKIGFVKRKKFPCKTETATITWALEGTVGNYKLLFTIEVTLGCFTLKEGD